MIYICGAGPGNPGLLTLKACECLRNADIILYDALVSLEILNYSAEKAKLVRVGKRGIAGSFFQRTPRAKTVTSRASDAVTQAAINELLLGAHHEFPGGTVVRLKGGDPFVFGRGGEEALYLAEKGIPFEIVPGVSSVMTAAFAGIPITHRGASSSFTVVTAQSDSSDNSAGIEYEHLARERGSVLILMGMSRIEEISREMIRYGRSPDTPSAIIQWGACPNQLTITANLKDLAKAAHDAQAGPPALIVIGEVVRLRDKLNWFETRPLFGKRILVTRAHAAIDEDHGSVKYTGSQTAAMLRDRGAQVIDAPLIRIEPLAPDPLIERLRRLDRYSDVIFTSGNAVRIFFDQLHRLELDSRALAGKRISVIGPSSAAAVVRFSRIKADIVPATATAEGLVEALGNTSGRMFLMPRAKEARDLIPDALGKNVDVIPVYKTVPMESSPVPGLIGRNEIDIAVFASSSAVRNFVQLLAANGDGLKKAKELRCIAIGPITGAALQSQGFDPYISKTPDIDGLIAACEER